MISVVAIGGAGVGLILVCIRALLPRPKLPPWLDAGLAAGEDPMAAPLSAPIELPPPAPLPLPLPPPRVAYPSVHETPTAPGIAAADIEKSIPSRAETTAEIDARSLSRLVTEVSTPDPEEASPATQRSGDPEAGPSGQTGPFFGESSPIPLVSKRPEELSPVASTLQTGVLLAPVISLPSPPPAEVESDDGPETLVRPASENAKSDPASSGLVVTGPAMGGRDFASFQYGARRA